MGGEQTKQRNQNGVCGQQARSECYYLSDSAYATIGLLV